MQPLWPHQERALSEIQQAIADGYRRICVTGPTGSGKSRIMFEQIKQQPEAALYTDRRMLLDQLAKGLESHGFRFGIRAAGVEPRLLEETQLCMVQTEASKVLKGDREIHRAKQAVIDEFHKNKEDSMMGLLEQHRIVQPGCVETGYTATPLGLGHMADILIVAGTNSELRNCGALVPAYHYGPDEPDTKWVGSVKIDGGECGIPEKKRSVFAKRVFGSVVEHYWQYNPQQRPALLFAPGVKESLWFAKELSKQGISAAHLDGSNAWIDGQEHDSTPDVREEIADRSQSGDIKVVCNRFVLREGIDWPWIYHAIFATVFGSPTTYIQAGGRILRAHPSMDHCIIQDHGGCWHRFGSLNEDREWSREDDDRTYSGVRKRRMQENEVQEPIVCPRCHMARRSGGTCPDCGYRHQGKVRIVLQKDGSLREHKGDIYRKPRRMKNSQDIQKEWSGRVRAIKKSKKETVARMTFAQLEVSFARDHNWMYPPKDLKDMPVRSVDWYKPIREITELT